MSSAAATAKSPQTMAARGPFAQGKRSYQRLATAPGHLQRATSSLDGEERAVATGTERSQFRVPIGMEGVDRSNEARLLRGILPVLLVHFVNMAIAIPVMPLVVRHFVPDGDIAEAQLVYGRMLSVGALVGFLVNPILGLLSDRVGRRPVLMIALSGSCLYLLNTSVAEALWLLYAGAFVQGMTAVVSIMCVCYVVDVSSMESRPANLGYVGAAMGLGFVIGPVVGGYLATIDHRTPFLVAGGIEILNLVNVYLRLPESNPNAIALEDLRDFSIWENNAFSVLMILRKSKPLFFTAMSLLLSALPMAGIAAVFVNFSVMQFGWTSTESGYFMAAYGLCNVLVQGGVLRHLVPIFGDRKLAIIAQALAVVSLCGYALSSQGWVLYVVLVVTSGALMTTPTLQSLLTKQVSPDEQGRLQGALSSLLTISKIFGPLVASTVFSATAPAGHPEIVFYCLSGICLCALCCTLVGVSGVSAQSAGDQQRRGDVAMEPLMRDDDEDEDEERGATGRVQA